MNPPFENYPQGVSLKPSFVSYFTDKFVSKVSCGDRFTVLLTDDGSIYSFGENDLGQLGSSDCVRSKSPLYILSGEEMKFVDVSCGKSHTLVKSVNGEVYGWGCNVYFIYLVIWSIRFY